MWISRLPWILPFVWLAVRWTTGMQLDVESAQNTGVLLNMLFILLLVFLGIHIHYRDKQKPPTGFLEDMKACVKPALIYALLSIVCIGVYYSWLSDDIQELRTAYITTFDQGIQDENNFNGFLAQHPELKGKSKEELMAMNRENVERNVSVQTRIMGGSLALTFVAVAYSVLAVFFWRTFVRKW
jgi:hypothetical protein